MASNAILARASISQGSHRTGFDVSLPLFHPNLPKSLSHLRNVSKEIKSGLPTKYFLTFKGRYRVDVEGQSILIWKNVGIHDDCNHPLIPLFQSKGKRYNNGDNLGIKTRDKMHKIHNGKDIIILTTCEHGYLWERFQAGLIRAYLDLLITYIIIPLEILSNTMREKIALFWITYHSLNYSWSRTNVVTKTYSSTPGGNMKTCWRIQHSAWCQGMLSSNRQ